MVLILLQNQNFVNKKRNFRNQFILSDYLFNISTFNPPWSLRTAKGGLSISSLSVLHTRWSQPSKETVMY